MAEPITLSIDAMGGDEAPKVVIDGVARARKDLPHVRFLLFGDEAQISPLMDRYAGLDKIAEVRHCDTVVGNDEKPSIALRTGRGSSMRRAIDAVSAGEAEGVVSAGNTGALMAMAKFVLKTLPGIDRPAIATVMPTLRGETVVLDLGANVECDADNLVQFAVMGEVFARNALATENPSVGILNVGEEDFKGHESVKRAAAILQESALAIRFHGFVEGDDIARGTVDVVVTDGFTGNIALKTAEGTSAFFTHCLREAMTSSVRAKLGAWLARNSLRQMKARMDPRRYNGAMLLGLNGICVKSHGGTDALGFSSAVGVAAKLITDRLNEGIKQDYSCVSADMQDGRQAAIG